MTERHDDSSGRGRAMNTGEFRATPDISASTAQFQAFAAGEAEPAARSSGTGGRATTRTTLLLVIAVLVLVAIAILIATIG